MLLSTESSKSLTKLATSPKNNHHFNQFSQANFYSSMPPSPPLNRCINETTCTTVTNIPCHHIKQKCSHQKSKVHSSEKDNSPSKKYHHTVPTSFLHQSLPFQKESSQLGNIFHTLSFHKMPSNMSDDDVPTISDEYQINSNTNNEQFQLLKNQFRTYLNDTQSNMLSRVIQLLSLCNHLNAEQIKDLLHNIGYTNLTIDDIHRLTTNDRRMYVNERFKNVQTTLNDHRKVTQ